MSSRLKLRFRSPIPLTSRQSSVRDHSSAPPGSPHQKYGRDQEQRDQPQNPEVIDISQHVGLALQISLKHRVSLSRSRLRGSSVRLHRNAGVIDHPLEVWVGRIQVR